MIAATQSGADQAAGSFFDVGDRGFIGFRFDIGGTPHFGWADITVNPQATVTLHRVAYETDTVIGAAIGLPAHVGIPDINNNNAVPEPATFGLGMLALGAVGVSALKRRREAEVAA